MIISSNKSNENYAFPPQAYVIPRSFNLKLKQYKNAFQASLGQDE